MPKAQQASSSHSATGPVHSNGTHPNVLKRNQACHQCRRRKLKWYVPDVAIYFNILRPSFSDAKRPCSTCVRSHSHAVSHAPAGAQLPSAPECTFDEIHESTAAPSETPKNKYERLENRISELEALLRQKENSAAEHDIQHQGVFSPQAREAQSSSPSQHSISNGNSHHLYPGSRNTSRSPLGKQEQGISETPSGASSHAGWDVLWPNWPPNLPEPELLRHLVEVFFLFHPHATRLFHATSFMTSLSLPPAHPRFPAPPVLHAICAVGSLYTGIVTSPPLPNLSEVEPDEIFSERYRSKEERPDSFAEQQVKLARDTAQRLEFLGQDLLQVLQANIILCWFYISHSKHVELFITAAHSLRLAVPLGLNMCPPFNSITVSQRPASILPPARTVVEDEMRRNAFWLAYANERQHGCTNGWAHSMDDSDISQLLPLRGDQYEQGALVTPHDRQWAHAKDLLVNHPENQIDSFIMYIKSSILISRVKTFNMRFRTRHYNGDEQISTYHPLPMSPNSTEPVDARMSAGFVELDSTISSFLSSFPPHLRNPINNNTVDNHLYTACLISHVANIILHDPHADVRISGCISALKILTSARAILDLIYAVWSTSFDITLLDSFCSFCWFTAGRVLVRFLQAAIEANSQDQISTLRAELDFILTALSKVGQRYAMAYRCAKMLEDRMVTTGGPPSGVMS
ncbi:hypothetical protein EV421DRAFT_1895773 [Armillaria borealis]|uniref:Xylanolytic transcriptional activator regulatory domain-containing protein n=1 Tax=Armillaria borealis TaxID=47425 RepID=A0AA39KD48_9AGAR|nr:hypothetical protein EV421DRAFT_1895773 [Armillaria borealis]